MIKVFILFFILVSMISTISLCFIAAKEEKFYNELILDKKIESDEK